MKGKQLNLQKGSSNTHWIMILYVPFITVFISPIPSNQPVPTNLKTHKYFLLFTNKSLRLKWPMKKEYMQYKNKRIKGIQE